MKMGECINLKTTNMKELRQKRKKKVQQKTKKRGCRWQPLLNIEFNSIRNAA